MVRDSKKSKRQSKAKDASPVRDDPQSSDSTQSAIVTADSDSVLITDVQPMDVDVNSTSSVDDNSSTNIQPIPNIVPPTASISGVSATCIEVTDTVEVDEGVAQMPPPESMTSIAGHLAPIIAPSNVEQLAMAPLPTQLLELLSQALANPELLRQMAVLNNSAMASTAGCSKRMNDTSESGTDTPAAKIAKTTATDVTPSITMPVTGHPTGTSSSSHSLDSSSAHYQIPRISKNSTIDNKSLPMNFDASRASSSVSESSSSVDLTSTRRLPLPPLHDHPCMNAEESISVYGAITENLTELMNELEKFLGLHVYVDVYCIDRMTRELIDIVNQRLLSDDEFTRASAIVKTAKHKLKRFMPKAEKATRSIMPPLVKLQPAADIQKIVKQQVNETLKTQRGAAASTRGRGRGARMTNQGQFGSHTSSSMTGASTSRGSQHGNFRGNIRKPIKPGTSMADPIAHQPQVEAAIEANVENKKPSLWAPDLPVHSGLYREALRLPTPRTPSQFARLGFMEGDTFLDTSVQGQRIELDSESQNMRYETSDSHPTAAKPKRFALICSGALKRLRLTTADHYHDWTDVSDVGNAFVQEDFWGQHWICDQFSVVTDFANHVDLQILCNRIVHLDSDIQYDLLVLVGGFNQLVEPPIQGVIDRVFLPNNAQWCNIIAQSLAIVGKSFAIPVVYGGLDVEIPSSNTGFLIRQAVEQIRMRNKSLWLAHKIYFADVLSRSEGIKFALYDTWRTRRMELLRQLIRSIVLRLDTFLGE